VVESPAGVVYELSFIKMEHLVLLLTVGVVNTDKREYYVADNSGIDVKFKEDKWV
jgi:hypothetical protein